MEARIDFGAIFFTIFLKSVVSRWTSMKYFDDIFSFFVKMRLAKSY